MSIYLAVETSCDETACAIVDSGRRVLSNTLLTQIEVHKAYGGVVPEVAARRHLETVNDVVQSAVDDSGIGFSGLDGIAFTQGPGLVGTLLVGALTAKSLAWAYDLPLVAVDHLVAHVCANFLETDIEPPFVALLVSGGHTQLLHFEDYRNFRLLGSTLDDAAGEAYDKVARLLGLGYPGGAVVDRLASGGDGQRFKFPEGVVAGYDFSFSGLKTAVLRCVEKLEKPYPVNDICAGFQNAVARVLAKKTAAAARELSVPRVVLAGGVAANSELRRRLLEECPCPVSFPPLKYCTDNAAMVAGAAFFTGEAATFEAGVYSRCRLVTR